MTKAEREKLQQIQFVLNARKKKSSLMLQLRAVGDLLDKKGKYKAADQIDRAIKVLAEEGEFEGGGGLANVIRPKLEDAKRESEAMEEMMGSQWGRDPVHSEGIVQQQDMARTLIRKLERAMQLAENGTIDNEEELFNFLKTDSGYAP